LKSSISSSTPLSLDDGHDKDDSHGDRSLARQSKIDKAGKLRQKRNIAVACYFALWYALSVAYNIYAKKALLLAPNLAWTSAWLQLPIGLLYVLPLWWSGLRKPPRDFDRQDAQRLLPIAFLHSLVHVGGVVSMSAGAVSFTYIVKASEPAVSAGLSALFLRSFLPWTVYLTLIPVMVGVSMASVSELTFTWKAFNYAMMSNIASASRGIVSKKSMTKNPGHGMNATNLYAVLTILSTILLLPIAVMMEGASFLPTMKQLFRAGTGKNFLLYNTLAAFFYYTYNEVSFRVLDNVSPVSHALGNTLKRVFIIVSSMLVFGNRMTIQGALGSVMAIGGVLLYSLAKSAAKKKAPMKNRSQ
jgi:solute carrier family 35 protein E1